MKPLKITFCLCLLLGWTSFMPPFSASAKNNLELVATDYLRLSEDLILALKNGEKTEDLISLLAASTQEEIQTQIDTDIKKRAFWMNIYNGFIQVQLKAHPEYYEDRRTFFNTPFIQAAGRVWSFGEIEHGIIRGGQHELMLGYIKRPFRAKHIRKLAVKKTDARIHFGLNCGAKSCPPVAVFNAENINKELERLKGQFLRKHSTYSLEENQVKTTALFSWFRGDFGGKKGVKKMLLELDIIPDTKVSLQFTTYDWTLLLDNYSTEEQN